MKTVLKKGFTIIEFLIVIGLVSLITTVSIAAYNNFLETSKLGSETQRLIAVLTLAQKRATAGENVSGGVCAVGYSFSGILVTTTASGGYTLQGQCSQDSNPSNTSTYGAMSYAIDPSNTNVILLTSTSILFPKLTGIPTSDSSITMKNISNNTCSRVTITSGVMSSSNPSCP